MFRALLTCLPSISIMALNALNMPKITKIQALVGLFSTNANIMCEGCMWAVIEPGRYRAAWQTGQQRSERALNHRKTTKLQKLEFRLTPVFLSKKRPSFYKKWACLKNWEHCNELGVKDDFYPGYFWSFLCLEPCNVHDWTNCPHKLSCVLELSTS